MMGERFCLETYVDKGPEEGKSVQNDEWESFAMKLESGPSHCEAEAGTSEAAVSICYINQWLSLNCNEEL